MIANSFIDSTGINGTVLVVSLVLSLVLPMVVALVTKAHAASSLKSIVLLALSAITGFLTQYVASPVGFRWQGALVVSITTFAQAVASHYGLLSNVGVTGSDGLIAQATSELGLGSNMASANGLPASDVSSPSVTNNLVYNLPQDTVPAVNSSATGATGTTGVMVIPSGSPTTSGPQSADTPG